MKQTEEIRQNSEKIDWKQLEELDVLLKPWIRLDGSLNRRVLDRLLGAVLCYVMQNPGKPVREISQKFYPALIPTQVRELLEILEEIKCLECFKMTKKSVSLFHDDSTFSDPIVGNLNTNLYLADENEILVDPAVDAVIKLGQFIGDKQYTQDFMPQCPCHV